MCSIGIQSEAVGILYKISSQKRPLYSHYKIYLLNNNIKKNQNIENNNNNNYVILKNRNQIEMCRLFARRVETLTGGGGVLEYERSDYG